MQPLVHVQHRAPHPHHHRRRRDVLGPGVLVEGRDQAPQGVACDFFGVREQVAHQPAKAIVLARRRLTPRAEFRPGDAGIQGQARIRLRDRNDEAGSQPFAEAGGHNKTTLVVQGVFDRTGKTRQVRLHVSSLGHHSTPLLSTIRAPGTQGKFACGVGTT